MQLREQMHTDIHQKPAENLLRHLPRLFCVVRSVEAVQQPERHVQAVNNVPRRYGTGDVERHPRVGASAKHVNDVLAEVSCLLWDDVVPRRALAVQCLEEAPHNTPVNHWQTTVWH
ncbi:hypothetical protein DQ04_12271020 [Trypanosoma grayi]|uniref:hypothetical protein n=1 Tax=Trypanosoma grayi TaxID=71804 RepID=UPI0004F47A58|nr:hypothetical protein DQ04_12271020 [Trypanosoma grayi]KEG06782.1 hypothetical protein DQ04_12271020 [Trypanosoma grayi]